MIANPPAHEITTPQGLRRNYLSGFELVAQSLGTLAPSASAALILPVIFAASRNGMWLVFAFTVFTLFLLATQMSIFGRRIASPGALYAYINDGLGSFWGVLAAWSIMIAYVFSIATIPAFVVNLVFGLLTQFFGYDGSRSLAFGIMILSVVCPWWLAQRDIKLSTRVTSLIELSTLSLIIILLAFFFWHKGTVVDPAQLHLQGFTFTQFHMGLVLAFFCFGGFETAAELGAEARQPLVSIPRTLKIIVGSVGLFFIFVAYGVTDAFQGVEPSLDKQDAPLTTLAHSLNADWIATLITVGIGFAMMACALGCLNASGRVLYALAHRGLFPAAVGVTHPTHSTPHRSIAIVAVITIIISVSLSLLGFSTMDLLTYLGTLGSFGFLLTYLLVAIAAPFYLKKQGKLQPWNVALAILTIALLIIPLAGSLYPVPEYPSNLLPYIFLAMLLVGISYFLYVKKTDPERLKLVEAELLGPGEV
jgi:amino acid transporter